MPTCLTYGFTGTTANESIYNYRSVRLFNNAIVLDELTFDPSAVATGTALPAASVTTNCTTTAGITGATTYTLSSTEVSISSLCFSSKTDTGTCYFDSATGTCKLNTTVPVGNEIDVCIVGQLKNGDVYTKTIKRAFVQPIFVRSSAVSS
jgi:hypothetical protein